VVWRDSKTFVTVGMKHIFFWTFDGATLKRRRGTSGKYGNQTLFTACWTKKGYCAVGSRDGRVIIYVPSGTQWKARKALKLHKVIFVIFVIIDINVNDIIIIIALRAAVVFVPV